MANQPACQFTVTLFTINTNYTIKTTFSTVTTRDSASAARTAPILDANASVRNTDEPAEHSWAVSKTVAVPQSNDRKFPKIDDCSSGGVLSRRRFQLNDAWQHLMASDNIIAQLFQHGMTHFSLGARSRTAAAVPHAGERQHDRDRSHDRNCDQR